MQVWVEIKSALDLFYCGAVSCPRRGCRITGNPLTGREGLHNSYRLYADDVLRGWHARDYSWDFSARVEHEFRRGISVSGGYFRNVLGNFM